MEYVVESKLLLRMPEAGVDTFIADRGSNGLNLRIAVIASSRTFWWRAGSWTTAWALIAITPDVTVQTCRS